jgi:hypothetical protein
MALMSGSASTAATASNLEVSHIFLTHRPPIAVTRRLGVATVVVVGGGVVGAGGAGGGVVVDVVICLFKKWARERPKSVTMQLFVQQRGSIF